MHRLLRETSHRPWPVPGSPWIMEQTWRDVLFAHWPYPADEVRAIVPKELPIDTFDGTAWIGVVPFMLENLKIRGLPMLPTAASFPELNVRTYVTLEDNPGVYFFSLDAASSLAVFGARMLFHLNYYRAEMNIARTATGIEYTSRRVDERARNACFRANYTPIGEAVNPEPGTLDYFLTERYCLYSVSDSGTHRLEIHHPPWLLQPAEADLNAHDMLTAAGLTPRAGAPLLHFSSVQPMIGWRSERVS